MDWPALYLALLVADALVIAATLAAIRVADWLDARDDAAGRSAGDVVADSIRDRILRRVDQHLRAGNPAPLEAAMLAAMLGRSTLEVYGWLRVCEQDGLLTLVDRDDPTRAAVAALTPAGRRHIERRPVR
jgi:hypothetical protein